MASNKKDMFIVSFVLVKGSCKTNQCNIRLSCWIWISNHNLTTVFIGCLNTVILSHPNYSKFFVFVFGEGKHKRKVPWKWLWALWEKTKYKYSNNIITSITASLFSTIAVFAIQITQLVSFLIVEYIWIQAEQHYSTFKHLPMLHIDLAYDSML